MAECDDKPTTGTLKDAAQPVEVPPIQQPFIDDMCDSVTLIKRGPQYYLIMTSTGRCNDPVRLGRHIAQPLPSLRDYHMAVENWNSNASLYNYCQPSANVPPPATELPMFVTGERMRPKDWMAYVAGPNLLQTAKQVVTMKTRAAEDLQDAPGARWFTLSQHGLHMNPKLASQLRHYILKEEEEDADGDKEKHHSKADDPVTV
ncbi:unnamed protein product, partial [Mesorhabditis spiculigera]